MRSKNALHVFQCSVNSRRTQQVTAQRNELVSSTAVKKVRGWGPRGDSHVRARVWSGKRLKRYGPSRYLAPGTSPRSLCR